MSFVRSFVSKQVNALKDRIDSVEAAVKAIPAGAKGDPGADAYEIAILNGFVGDHAEWLKSLKGEKGDDGKFDVDYFVETVRAEVAARVAEIPKPKDGDPGKDADPAVVAELVAKSVAEIVAAIPAPAPGKDADPEVIRAMIAEAVAAIPGPENGKDADMDALKSHIDAVVAERVAALPPAEPGKDADLDFMLRAIDDAVTKAMASIPKPENGKDADPDVIRAMVAEAVAAIPPAAPGKDADPTMVRALVAEAVAEIPPAQPGEPGKDADPTVIAEIVAKSVAEIVSALPKPEKGEDGKDADPELVRGIVQDLVDKALAALPAPEPAEPVHEDTIARIAFEAAQKAVSAIPTPRDGLDAVQINIHPMMEEGKSYPSGVYIRHKGGLVRTTATGYDVIINGVDSETETTLEDGRTIERTTIYTDGTKFVRQHKFAVMMHRGTWVQKTYDRGDCVMRDNCSWCCMAETTETMPGTSKDWQLIARKGDRGKDAPAPKQPPGPVKL